VYPQAAGHAVLPELLKPFLDPSLLEQCSYETLPVDFPDPEEKKEEDDGKGGPASFLTFKVETIAFQAGQAMDFLLRFSGKPGEIRTGDSLAAWKEALSAMLALVRAGRFIPGTSGLAAEGSLRGRWKLSLPDPAAEALAVLGQAFPGIVEAAAGERLRKTELLYDFIETTGDAFIRKCAAPLLPSLFASVEEQWLKSLAAPAGAVKSLKAPEEEILTFEKSLKGWISGGSENSLRLCLRLVEPAASEERWLLEFHLQDNEDRSLIVSAPHIWRKDSAAMSVLKKRTPDPAALLLAELGRGALLYPPLLKALGSKNPELVTLSGSEAYDFLREHSLSLRARNFGIQIPAWWHEKKRRFTSVLKIKPGAGESKGIQSLIDYDWEVLAGGEKMTLEELEALARLKIPLLRLRGKWVEFRAQEIENVLRFFEKKSAGKHGKMPMSQALRLALEGDVSDLGIPVSGIEAEGWAGAFLQAVDAGGTMELIEVPAAFQGVLRPYQLRGASWLAYLVKWGFGACLADDMGLGKTVQVIALLLYLKQHEPESTLQALLVAPTSIVGNWQREVKKFAPGLRVIIHHGEERSTGGNFAQETSAADLVITTYSLASRDRELLASRRWPLLILDEAQNIKNENSQAAQAVKSFDAGARVVLTGTPVENRLSELWSIMDFLNRGYLGSAAGFKEKYQNSIEKRGDEDKVRMLKRLISPFLLRRLKTDKTIIQDLPEKMEMKVFCSLTAEQVSLYKAVVKEMMEKIAASTGIQRRGFVLSALLQLKQVCNHPAHHQKDKSELGERSGKFNRLTEMLEEVIAEGDKALVFTQFTEMGELLLRELPVRLGTNVLFFHGGLRADERDRMVEDFQTKKDKTVLVLSTKAGGTGLNLTAANHVFHFDRWWNPAVENQASDRAFRIGQVKRVQVHKFVCAGTVEERIDQLIERKAALADAVITSGEDFLTELGTEELREMLSLAGDANL